MESAKEQHGRSILRYLNFIGRFGCANLICPRSGVLLSSASSPSLRQVVTLTPNSMPQFNGFASEQIDKASTNRGETARVVRRCSYRHRNSLRGGSLFWFSILLTYHILYYNPKSFVMGRKLGLLIN